MRGGGGGGRAHLLHEEAVEAGDALLPPPRSHRSPAASEMLRRSGATRMRRRFMQLELARQNCFPNIRGSLRNPSAEERRLPDPFFPPQEDNPDIF